MDDEIHCLKRKNENLEKTFIDTMAQRNFDLSKATALNEELQTLKNDKETISKALKGILKENEPRFLFTVRF